MATGPSNERRGYRRIAELGRGGMATVHLAAMQGSHGVTKLVVVKELRPELAVNDEFVVMFFDEARLAARLNHPNIVQSYEVGEEDGRQFIVMEYLEGQPLHRVWNKLQAAGKMSLALNLQVVHDVLAGLDYAHELTEFNGTHLKIVHRDISPHNVFVTYTGDVKVVDFGIAKAADSSTQTRVGTLKGKLTYMPPEQAMGEPVDRRADLFAVGVLLWESAAGRRLWQGMNDGAIMRALMTGDIPSLLSVNPDLPPRLDDICRRALAPKRDARYATAGDFQRDIERLMQDLGVHSNRRELGSIVTELFADDRAMLRASIDDALNRGDPNAVETVVGAYPKVNRPQATNPGMFASGSQQAVGAPTGSSGSFVAFAHTGESSQISRVQTNPGTTNTGASISMIGQVPQPAPKKINTVIIVLGVALAIAAGALLAIYSNRIFPASTTTPAGSGSAAAASDPSGGVGTGGNGVGTTSAGTSTAGTTNGTGIVGAGGLTASSNIHLQVKGVPFGGQVLLDGTPLTPTPQGYVVPADGKPHKITAVANGQSREQTITLDRDQTLDLSLGGKAPSGGGGGGGKGHPTGGGGGGKHTDNGNGTPDLGY